MKTPFVNLLILVLCITLTCCGKKSHEHDMDHHDEVAAADQGDKNKPLYDEVMNVHNEVMPKMDEIYRIKESLKNKIATTPAMGEAKKKEIETAIVKLDSSSEGMMAWMRKFKPLPDSAGEEAAREYLEKEKVKVTKVKEDMLHAIDIGKALN